MVVESIVLTYTSIWNPLTQFQYFLPKECNVQKQIVKVNFICLDGMLDAVKGIVLDFSMMLIKYKGHISFWGIINYTIQCAVKVKGQKSMDSSVALRPPTNKIIAVPIMIHSQLNAV